MLKIRKNPKDTISKEFLNEFKTDFKDFDIGYVKQSYQTVST